MGEGQAMGRTTYPKNATDEWRAIARGPDVLYHICTWPEKRGLWTEEDFYEAGRSDWDDFVCQWRHYDEALGGTCVEIGCGAGRVTSALAPFFEHVVALDVSPDMIERAQRHCPPNVEFRRVDGPQIPLAEHSVDAVFSVHVLQHLESTDVMAAYLAEALRVLRPGRTLMVHIMLIDGKPSLRRRLAYEWRLRRSRMALGRGEEHTSVRMTLLTTQAALDLLTRTGFVDVELRMFPVRSNGYHHAFWLARRPLDGRSDAVTEER
jgi:SAM-dependent methyltransferase